MLENKEERTVETKITPEDMVKFVGKLEDWGQTLPDKEQVLLQILLALAHNSPKNAETRLDLEDFEKLAKQALQGIVKQSLTFTESQPTERVAKMPPRMKKAWVRGGPLWCKWSSRQY
jgi:hypothetical protein